MFRAFPEDVAGQGSGGAAQHGPYRGAAAGYGTQEGTTAGTDGLQR